MAQKQLNDPPPVLEGSSFSDQTSQLDETRPPDPPDHSLSLTSDEPSISLASDSPGPSVSPSPVPETIQPPDPLDHLLSLRSDEQPSVSITPDSMGPSVSPSPGLESSQSISLSPPRVTGSFCDKIMIIAFSIVNLRPISLPPSFGM